MNSRKTLYSVLALCAVLAVLLHAEVVNGALTILGTLTASGAVDFKDATSTFPSKIGTSAPTACTLGQTFFDTDATAGSNWLLCTATGNPGTWTAVSGGGTTYTARDNLRDTSGTLDFDPTDVSTVWEYDDFRWHTLAATSITDSRISWSVTAVGTSTASVALQASSWPNIGIVRVTTGSVADGNGNGLALKGSDVLALGNLTDKPWRMVWVFKLGQTSGQRFHIGTASASNAVPVNGFGLRHDTNASAKCGAADTTNFMFWSYNNSGPSDACYDTGVAVDGNFHTLVMRSDGTTNQKVWLSLDGGTERSVCSSGCDFTATVTTTAVIPVATVVNSSGGSATRYVDFDTYGFTARVSNSKNDRNP